MKITSRDTSSIKTEKMLPILLVLVAFCAYMFQSYRNHLQKYPRGPLPLPIVGNIHQLNPANPELTLHAWGEQYGGMYTITIGTPTVVITDSHLIKEALVGANADALSGRVDTYSRNHFAYGKNGILSSDGQLWQTSRRFALHSLRNLGFGRNQMEAKVEKHVNWLTAEMSKSVGSDSYCMFDDLQISIGSIITDVIYSRDHYDNRDVFFSNVHQIEVMFDVASAPLTMMLDRYPFLRHVPVLDNFNDAALTATRTHMYTYYQAIIDKHKIDIDYSTPVADANDFVDAFLLERRRLNADDEPEWSDRQLSAIMNDLWIAGMETTITTTKWFVLFMMNNPTVQKKARDEVNFYSIPFNNLLKIHQSIGTDRMVTMADKSVLPYVQACITESQRCANIVPLNVFHRATRDVKMSNGLMIPKDTAVLPQISSALKSKDLFGSDADDFRPERFLTSDGKSIDKTMIDKMTAFSLGKRQCLGESLARVELFMISTRLLQLFKMSAVGKLNMTPLFKGTLQPVKYNVRMELA